MKCNPNENRSQLI